MTEYAFGDFRLDRSEQRVTHGDTPIKLTAKTYGVLALLVERAPATVSRAEFESLIWPEGFVDPANLTQTVYVLRKALAAHANETIVETVNGRGYRLVLPTRTRAIANDLVEAAPVVREAALGRLRGALFERRALWRVATSLVFICAIVAVLAVQNVRHHVQASAGAGAGHGSGAVGQHSERAGAVWHPVSRAHNDV